MRWFLIPNNHTPKFCSAISIIHSTLPQSCLTIMLLNSETEIRMAVAPGLGGEGMGSLMRTVSFWGDKMLWD